MKSDLANAANCSLVSFQKYKMELQLQSVISFSLQRFDP